MVARLGKYLSGLAVAVTLASAPLEADAEATKDKPKKKSHVTRVDQELVEVEDVFALSSGQFVVVLRTFVAPHRYLPVWIGEAEALAIRLRLDRQTPPRPLTLNLLEQIMDSSNVELIEIAIDDVRGGVFLGKLKLRQNTRAFNVDARPSDAIGLALGRNAPIWVAKTVLQDSAFDPNDFKPKGPGADETPGAAGTPSSYGETL
jgi:uncharacterized protein